MSDIEESQHDEVREQVEVEKFQLKEGEENEGFSNQATSEPTEANEGGDQEEVEGNADEGEEGKGTQEEEGGGGGQSEENQGESKGEGIGITASLNLSSSPSLSSPTAQRFRASSIPSRYQKSDAPKKPAAPGHESASRSFATLFSQFLREDDLQEIVEKQDLMLKKFQDVNRNLAVFNEFSAKRFNDTSKDFDKHIKMLVGMKTDLDSIFRRIRTLQVKLSKQYPEAFRQVDSSSN